MIYVFGNYKLDTLNYELYDDGNLCKLDPRAFKVLIYLIEHRDHIVSREELVEHLWPGQIISEAVINNCIKAARKAIGDSGEGQHTIRTLYGRGYRFMAEAQGQSPVTPMFHASQPHDGHAPSSPVRSSVDPPSPSQNVLVGDYGVVTVLCGALENHEALSASLGFEVTQSLRRTFFALAQEEAKRHEGAFKFFGADGFLMVFGLPVVHEDHVRRSLLAGLSLQERLYASCSALEPQPPVDATVRMGLHTGLIEIKSQRDHRPLASLTKSETTALAIRLHYQAKGGKLLTSKATIPYIQEMITYVEHGAFPMPGHAQPIMAYRICGLAAATTDLSNA
ncbi:MAG: winged helix-turn-helix domain-containing protein [Candidatus Tectomicrobia bacterium]